MKTIIVENAEALLVKGDNESIAAYFFSEGFVVTVEGMSLMESSVLFGSEEELISAALCDLTDDQGKFELQDGKVPGYEKCSGCDEWFITEEMDSGKCSACRDYDYRMNNLVNTPSDEEDADPGDNWYHLKSIQERRNNG